jgi:hypothetical protein
MCNNCYHSRGRKKRAWKCQHKEKFHYAHGLCQNCYQYNYCKIPTENQQEEVKSSSDSNFDLNKSNGVVSLNDSNDKDTSKSHPEL